MPLRIVLSCLALLLTSNPGTGATAPPPRAVHGAAPALEVSALMRNVENLKGQVLVEGVVSQVFRKEQTLALIDAAEFKRCGVVTCAEEVLPVRWAGKMPQPKDLVRIEGEVRKSPSGLAFVARSVTKVQPPAGNR